MTAPHGPSEKVVVALVRANYSEVEWAALSPVTQTRILSEIGPKVRRSLMFVWPTIVAEVRAAVVAECVAVADDALARFTQLAKPLDSDPDRDPVQQYVDAAMGADFVADRLRSQLPPVSAPSGCLECGGQGWYFDGPPEDPVERQCLSCNGGAFPPVSAPGPTLPEGWEAATMSESTRGREWACLNSDTGDVVGLDGRGLLTFYGFDSLPVAELQAIVAYLASRAERGPDAGRGEG